MTDERAAIEALARATQPPATPGKKFAREMAATPENHVLTVRQRAYLWALCYRFRRQMPPRVLEALDARRAQPGEMTSFEDQLDSKPDDAGLRLIYADWLEEHGWPDRAAAQRWMVERGIYPELKGAGATYGFGGSYHFEWSVGMEAWMEFNGVATPFPWLSYWHTSRQKAELALAAALEKQQAQETL